MEHDNYQIILFLLEKRTGSWQVNSIIFSTMILNRKILIWYTKKAVMLHETKIQHNKFFFNTNKSQCAFILSVCFCGKKLRTTEPEV